MVTTTISLFKLKNDTSNDTKKILVPITTHFAIRKYVRKKDGKSPLTLHASQSGVRKRIALDLHTFYKEWNPKKERCKKDTDVNLILENIQKKITEIKTQYRLNNSYLTLTKFVYEFEKGFSRFDFIEFYELMVEEQCHTYSSGTYRRYKSVCNKMKAYQKQWYFADITVSFLERYCNHLRKNNRESTVMANMSAIRKFLYEAKRNEIQMPLNIQDLKIKEIKTIPTTLEVKELELIWKYYFSEFIPKFQKLTVGYFLMSCFTGLRVSDLLQMKRQKGESQYKIISQKTQKPITINLSKKAEDVLKEEPKLFMETLTDQYMNKKLKLVGTNLGIHKNLTMHVGRHTFATNYIRMGGNQTDLQNLLGHSSSRMTERYINIAYEESSRNINLIDNVF